MNLRAAAEHPARRLPDWLSASAAAGNLRFPRRGRHPLLPSAAGTPPPRCARRPHPSRSNPMHPPPVPGARRGTRPASAAALILLIPVVLAGCGPADHYPVTGKNDSDPTWKGTQSETASGVAFAGGKTIFISTWNDDTEDGKVVYSTNDRVVFRGASYLGWSYSTDRGKTWTYGGKVKPPQGIAGLWGDPAIVTSRTAYNRVYISSLYLDTAAVPVTGHHGWMTDGTITGACVARSDDGGIHFAIQSCMSTGSDFYDGAAMASGFGS